MDAQPKIGGFGCFKGVLQIPFFLLVQFHKAIFYFNPKMGHMLNLAMVDKLNRAGFVVAPYNTPEEESSVKACLGRLGTLQRLITASATVAEEALAEKIGAG